MGKFFKDLFESILKMGIKTLVAAVLGVAALVALFGTLLLVVSGDTPWWWLIPAIIGSIVLGAMALQALKK